MSASTGSSEAFSAIMGTRRDGPGAAVQPRPLRRISIASVCLPRTRTMPDTMFNGVARAPGKATPS
jgi:hypothetical protein